MEIPNNNLIEERKEKLLEIGKKRGNVTYKEISDHLKGLDPDSDLLRELYEMFKENNIEIVTEE